MSEATRKVTIIRDKSLEYPELWCSVYLEASYQEKTQFAEIFSKAGCRRANTPEEADFVVFSGGPDVDPLLYGALQHPTTHIDPARDTSDMALYLKCLDQGIPMIGVCRGAQFLHVMNGGELYQDVNHHYGEHTIWDRKNNRIVHGVSSVHHQLCKRNSKNGMDVIAEVALSDKRASGPNDPVEMRKMQDVEAFFYRDTCCFGVQGHPEYRGYQTFTVWFLNMIEDLIIHNPDLGYEGKNLRVKKELRDQRSAGWHKPPSIIETHVN